MSGIWLKIGKKRIGPLAPVAFEKYVTKGRIDENDYAWNYDRRDWIQLKEIKEFDPFYQPAPHMTKFGKVVAIGGSKGGVGKTSLVASLALELAKAGKKIIAVDADFTDPDLKEWLGIEKPSRTIADFFERRVTDLGETLVPCSMPNLSVICGDSKSIDTSNPLFTKRRMFANQLFRLEADYILIDLGPGASYSNVDLFLASDEKIMVTIPEPTSILSSVRFIRLAFLRSLARALRFCPVSQILLHQYEKTDWRYESTSLAPLLTKIEKLDPRTDLILKSLLCRLHPKLVMNMVMNEEELKEGYKMIRSLSRQISLKVDYMGFIEYNPKYREASKENKPFLLNNSNNSKNNNHKKRHSFWDLKLRRNPKENHASSEPRVKNDDPVKSMFKNPQEKDSGKSVIDQLRQ